MLIHRNLSLSHPPPTIPLLYVIFPVYASADLQGIKNPRRCPANGVKEVYDRQSKLCLPIIYLCAFFRKFYLTILPELCFPDAVICPRVRVESQLKPASVLPSGEVSRCPLFVPVVHLVFQNFRFYNTCCIK